MANLYRKTALDKLFSPEKTDKTITIISPSFWIAMIGMGIVIAIVLVWSIIGRIPISVSANGMYMGNDGIYNAVAEANGVVEKVYVSEGQDVIKGEKLVKLDDSSSTESISDLEERIDIVEDVTFWSNDDTENADTKPLIDIKSQADMAGGTLTSDQAALRERYKELSKQNRTVADAKSKRNSAKNKYDELNAEYNSYHYEDKMTAAKANYAAAVQARSDYQKDHPNLQPGTSEYEQLEKLKMAETEALKAKQDLETDYLTLQTNLKNSESTYSIAEQEYKTERSTKKSLNDAISQLEAKAGADSKNKNNQLSSLEKQFKAAKGGLLDQLRQELRIQNKEMESMLFTARMDGKVTDINVSEGDAVQSGMTVVKLVSAGSGKEDTVLYMPAGNGRKIRKGMKTAVYPSTVNRQEYGHMDGIVESVSVYTNTSEDLLNELGDPSLVQAFKQAGPVVRIYVKLESDPDTVSGFKWSSRKGAEVEITEGTIVSADVVTEYKAPISMVIPYLKEKLTIKRDQEDED